MIAPEDVKKSLLLVNKYDKLKIYTAWKQFFILFGLADILTSVIILLSYSFKINLLISILWILLPIINLPLILLGTVLVIVSYKYKLGKFGLQARINNKKIISNKFYWQILLVTLTLEFLSFFLNFYTSTRISNYIPNYLFLANQTFFLGLILAFLSISLKYLYNELNFKELLIFGLILILIISPLLYIIQFFLFQTESNSFSLLTNIIDPNNNSKFLEFLIPNLFLILLFFISIILILFGLYHYFKLRKRSVLGFVGIGILILIYPIIYFLNEVQTFSTTPLIVWEINQNNIQGLFTSLIKIYLLLILIKGIFLEGLGVIQSNKIKNL